MPEEEVEIEPEEEEYEVVPLSPVRKLEKRIEELEKEKETGGSKAMVNEVMDLVKSNQKMVDEIVKSNDELRRELEKIPSKVDKVVDQWQEFLDILKEGEGEKVEAPGVSGELSEKFDKLLDQNEEMLDSMKSLKRAVKGSTGTRRSSSRGKGSPKVRIKKEK